MKVDRRSRWLLAFSSGAPVSHRIFCFGFAGGGASVFRRFAASVPDGVEVCAVQLPGREDRYAEPALTNIQSLAASVLPELHGYFDRPTTFFGHSMGALLSFELLREMRRQGVVAGPEHLFVSGRRAPDMPARRRDLYALPRDEFWHAIANLQGTPREVLADPELKALVEPVLRADFEACETYHYEPEAPLATPITALGATDDTETTLEELDRWREHTTSFGGVRMFSGHHFYLLTQWDTVAEVVTTGSGRGA